MNYKYGVFIACCRLISKLKPYLIIDSLDYYIMYHGTESQYKYLLLALTEVDTKYHNDLKIFIDPSDIDRRFIIKEKNAFVRYLPFINPFKLEEIKSSN